LVSFIINIVIKLIPSLGVLAVVVALAIAYQVAVLLGLWRVADKYQGRKVLAKIATVLGWLGVLGSL
jgi:hypothetical protein